MGGIGSPKTLIENFRALEEAGVDQLIFLQQSGNYCHEHICDSIELFGKEVLPQFKERETIHAEAKQEELAPFIEIAESRIEELRNPQEILPVEAYPLVWNKKSVEIEQITPDRRPGMSAFWQMQVGGNRTKK